MTKTIWCYFHIQLNGAGEGDYLHMVYVVVRMNRGIDRLQSDIENLLRVRHRIKDTNLDDFNIQNMNSIMETMEQTTGTFDIIP